MEFSTPTMPKAKCEAFLSFELQHEWTPLPSSGYFRETFRNAKRDKSIGRITSFNKLNQENKYYKILFFLFTDIWNHFLLSFLIQNKKIET